MANVKDLKVRIKSTKGTHKITSAMKLVSAAKLARAQASIYGARPYARELDRSVKDISALVEENHHAYLQESTSKQKLLLVISSNKGLCGGFNAQLIKEVSNFCGEHEGNIKVHFLGKKAFEGLRGRVNSGKLFTHQEMYPTYQDVKSIGAELASSFLSGEIGEVYLAYNQLGSALSFIPSIVRLLPMSISQEEKKSLREKYPFDFKYEPSAKELLNKLIPEAYTTSLYTCLLDSIAAEHGARMAAMDKASKSCKDMIRTLTLKMNKLRQAAITTELIEVVSGAESLNG